MGKTAAKTRSVSQSNSGAEQLDQHEETATIHEATFNKLLEMQQNIFQKCLQSFMESTNTRIDNFMAETIKSMSDLTQPPVHTAGGDRPQG